MFCILIYKIEFIISIYITLLIIVHTKKQNLYFMNVFISIFLVQHSNQEEILILYSQYLASVLCPKSGSKTALGSSF